MQVRPLIKKTEARADCSRQRRLAEHGPNPARLCGYYGFDAEDRLKQQIECVAVKMSFKPGSLGVSTLSRRFCKPQRHRAPPPRDCSNTSSAAAATTTTPPQLMADSQGQHQSAGESTDAVDAKRPVGAHDWK
jgi:hypothetical protein